MTAVWLLVLVPWIVAAAACDYAARRAKKRASRRATHRYLEIL